MTTITIPHFEVCGQSGRYKARRKITEQQLIKAALALVKNRFKPGVQLVNTSETIDYLKLYFADKQREILVGVFLDRQSRVIAIDDLAIGTVDEAHVYTREIVHSALKHNACSVIFAHNHPSGIAKPSFADASLTCELIDALKTVSIRVIEHIIIGGDRSHSLMAKDKTGRMRL